jgi:hypothetical protein
MRPLCNIDGRLSIEVNKEAIYRHAPRILRTRTEVGRGNNLLTQPNIGDET